MKNLFIILFFILLLQAFAQQRITTPNPVLVVNTKYCTIENDSLVSFDTIAKNFHRYNATEKQTIPYYNLGNFGTAYYPLFFMPRTSIGFNSGYNSFNLYYLKPNQIKFFDTKTPYTNLDFIFGAKEEVIGGADFSMNINKQNNLGFSYHRNSFKGQAQEQQSIYNNLSIPYWFRSKNTRYDLKSCFLLNSVKNQENGGFATNDIFTNDLYKGKKNKIYADVNLTTATQKYTERNLFFVQTIRLGKSIKDTIKHNFSPSKYALEHQFSYQRNTSLFKIYQQDSTFFNQHLLNPDSTHDYTKSWQLSNTIQLKSLAAVAKKNPFLFSAGLQFNLIKYHQFTTNNFLVDIQLKAQLQSKADSSKFHYIAKTAISVSPTYIGNFYIDATATYHINDAINLSIQNYSILNSPTQKEQQLLSNHYVWNNQFKKTIIQRNAIQFNWKAQLMSVQLAYTMMKNYIYYDTISQAKQHTAGISILQCHLKKDFNTKHIYIGNNFWVQWISNKNIIRLPTFALLQTVYYKGGWISGKLNAHLGFDIRYNTNFRANSYNPALAEFYLQDQQQLKFYPILDAFFNLYVKQTCIFMRMEHLSQGWSKQKGIYTAPNYAYLDRTFRVGVNWQFFD